MFCECHVGSQFNINGKFIDFCSICSYWIGKEGRKVGMGPFCFLSRKTIVNSSPGKDKINKIFLWFCWWKFTAGKNIWEAVWSSGNDRPGPCWVKETLEKPQDSGKPVTYLEVRIVICSSHQSGRYLLEILRNTLPGTNYPQWVARCLSIFLIFG